VRSRVTRRPQSRRSLWDGDPSGGRVGRNAGRRRRACWAGARPSRQRKRKRARDNAAAPRRHRAVAAIRPLPTKARPLIAPSSLEPARLADEPRARNKRILYGPARGHLYLLRRRTIMPRMSAAMLIGTHGYLTCD
jgi:hypothetical protein